MHSLEPFLLMLSSVFVPLYGVILARLAGQANVVSLVTERRVNYSAVVIWLLGVACYHLCAQLAPSWGAALPTLVLTFVLARGSPVPAAQASVQRFDRFKPHGLRRVAMVQWPTASAGAYFGARLQCSAYIGARSLHSLQQGCSQRQVRCNC